jgi:hypothetical protein
VVLGRKCLATRRQPDSPARLGKIHGSGFAPASTTRRADRPSTANTPRTRSPFGIKLRAGSRAVPQPASLGDSQEPSLPWSASPADGPCGLLARTPSQGAEEEPPKRRDRWDPVRGPSRLPPRRRRGLHCPTSPL